MKIVGTVPALQVATMQKRKNSPYATLWDAVDKAPAGQYVLVAAENDKENKRILAALYARRTHLKVVHAGLEHYVARNHSTNKGGN